MDTAALKSFATKARTDLMKGVAARLDVVLATGSNARAEQPGSIAALERVVEQTSRDAVVERVAYTWFNRIIALRFMDAKGYTGVGVVSPEAGKSTGQPQVLSEAKGGDFDSEVVSQKSQAEVTALLGPGAHGADPQGAAYGLLLEAYCRFWNKSMPFMFEREGDYTELLIPSGLLSSESVRGRAVAVLTEEVCDDVEVIGWLYQFYISERKDEVFDGFKKNKKAGAAEIPAATQLFTPHWIVRYLVENSLGRLWLLNHPNSRLVDQMDYYIAPVDQETDFLKISKPEELKVIDPAVGSGHMLTYAFDLLYSIYEEEGYTPSEIPGLILEHNLYGTEIDPRAGALAAFALTMKAAAKRKLFLKNPALPNICVIQNVSFDPFELDYLWSLSKNVNVARAEADEFWNAFAHADTFGSLIRAKEELITLLKSVVDIALNDGDLLQSNTLMKANWVLEQSSYLSQRYSVVVANPPYMGSRNYSSALSDFASRVFPNTRTDLYSMFIERGLALTVRHGLTAMITMESWMFIHSFETLRQLILSTESLSLMAHLGPRAFDSIAGEVVGTTAFVVKKGRSNPIIRARFVRAVSPTSEVSKALVLKRVASGEELSACYDRNTDMFIGVNGTPLAYWLPEEVLAAMLRPRHIGDLVSFPTSPHKTGDNGSYIRRWWEISFRDIGTAARWVPYAKGGGTRRWSGLMYDVVDWSPSALRFYRENPSSSLMKRDPDAPLGITYSMLTSGTNTFRVLPGGAAFDMGGPGLFPRSLSLNQAMAVLNSDMTRMVLNALNPTLNLQVREVKQVPVPVFNLDEESRLEKLAGDAIAITEEDWNSHEISLGFVALPLIASGNGRICDAAESLFRANEDVTKRLTEIEESIDRLIWSAAEVPAQQRGDEGTRAILFANAELEYGRGKSQNEYQVDAIADAVKSLVSLAVGCMFGRYSLDKTGLILADQGSTLQNYMEEVPSPSFFPDTDNVIPIVDGDWFEDDIVTKFRQFLRTAFGEEHFAENLTFVTESLGVKNLRDYFTKSFYKDHVQRYKKRPIYWLFSSPKGSFNALVYLHRYNPSTVSTVLNDNLREYIKKLESELSKQEHIIASGAGAREVASSQKEADRIRKVLIELNDYERELYDLASQQIPLDLDDGVLVNYQKFGTALKDIGLKKVGVDE